MFNRFKRLERQIDKLQAEVFDIQLDDLRASTRLDDVEEHTDKQGLILDALLKHLGLEFHQVEDQSINGVESYNELRPIKKGKE